MGWGGGLWGQLNFVHMIGFLKWPLSNYLRHIMTSLITSLSEFNWGRIWQILFII